MARRRLAVSYLSMTSQHVTFARIREREKAYIDFFSALTKDLARVPAFLKVPSPDGQSCIHWPTCLGAGHRSSLRCCIYTWRTL